MSATVNFFQLFLHILEIGILFYLQSTYTNVTSCGVFDAKPTPCVKKVMYSTAYIHVLSVRKRTPLLRTLTVFICSTIDDKKILVY